MFSAGKKKVHRWFSVYTEKSSLDAKGRLKYKKSGRLRRPFLEGAWRLAT